MGSLHQVLWRNRHVVTQVVETELVVRTKGDVTLVCLTTSLGVWLVLVDSMDGQSVEHIQRTHPLGVTVGKVVVDRYDMYAITCQRIQKDG